MIGIIGAMKVELEALKARLQDVTVTRISGVDFYQRKAARYGCRRRSERGR